MLLQMDIIKRLGDPDRIHWLCEAQWGEVGFRDAHRTYAPGMCHSFTNTPTRPEVQRPP
jgi:hypothetical protein